MLLPEPQRLRHRNVVVSVAHVQAEILSTPIEEGREVMDLALRAFVSFARRNNALELFDEGAGAVFSRIAQLDLRIDDDEDLGDMSRMDVATAIDRNLPHGFTISRADLAACLLALLNDPAVTRRHVSVAS